MGINILTVSQLNRYVKSLLDENKLLGELYIKGEISNFTNHYKSGHLYFTLKDKDASIKCVMFASSAKFLRFTPENGMSVLVGGTVSIYEKEGVYQFYATDMQPDGIGALSVAYEQLKIKLLEEGLFNAENKQTIPSMPKNIGIITSKDGAALQDILNILSRRYPIGKTRIYPATVQGVNSAQTIVKALNFINKENICDVIIVARGGGSIEDLWSFNEEIVVRAIYKSEIPVISAVGHETDFTLSDFVADLRAATPSEAAELVAVDILNLKSKLNVSSNIIKKNIKSYLGEKQQKFDKITLEFLKVYPKRYIQNGTMDLISKEKMLAKASFKAIEAKRDKFLSKVSLLNSLSPLAVLSRGYTITKTDDNFTLESIKVGQTISTTTHTSIIKSKVISVKTNK